MDAISYIILLAIIVVLLVLVITLDKQRNRWTDLARGFAEEAYDLYCKNARLRLHLDIAEEVNQQLAEQLVELVPATPPVSPDDAIAAMRYCGTCHTYMHPHHFVVQPMHYATTAP
jgi:hypothetical protein